MHCTRHKKKHTRKLSARLCKVQQRRNHISFTRILLLVRPAALYAKRSPRVSAKCCSDVPCVQEGAKTMRFLFSNKITSQRGSPQLTAFFVPLFTHCFFILSWKCAHTLTRARLCSSKCNRCKPVCAFRDSVCAAIRVLALQCCRFRKLASRLSFPTIYNAVSIYGF